MAARLFLGWAAERGLLRLSPEAIRESLRPPSAQAGMTQLAPRAWPPARTAAGGVHARCLRVSLGVRRDLARGRRDARPARGLEERESGALGGPAARHGTSRPSPTPSRGWSRGARTCRGARCGSRWPAAVQRARCDSQRAGLCGGTGWRAPSARGAIAIAAGLCRAAATQPGAHGVAGAVDGNAGALVTNWAPSIVTQRLNVVG